MRQITWIALFVVMFGLAYSQAAFAANYICAQDLSGDGDVDEPGETAQCITSEDGELCPISAVDCLATYSEASCPSGGGLNSDTDKCETDSTANYSCPYGGSYNSKTGLCEKQPIRFFSIFICFPPYAYNSSTGFCEAQPTMSETCPSGYVLNPRGDTCEAEPTCASGTYEPTVDQCYEGDITCPLGSYVCMDNGSSYQCSPNNCMDLDANPPVADQADLSSYRNDGTVDSSGVCLGELYIFNGKGSECRAVGVQTNFFNCCGSGMDNFLFIQKGCKEEEWETVSKKDAGACHYIGDYCKEDWPFVGCVQKAQVYCCFNSKLGRIIHEQGRIQLQKFAPGGNWGTPKAPNCVGFTPGEFSMLDFSRIDLSEYFGDIAPKSLNQVQQEMEQNIQDFQRNLQ